MDLAGNYWVEPGGMHGDIGCLEQFLEKNELLKSPNYPQKMVPFSTSRRSETPSIQSYGTFVCISSAGWANSTKKLHTHFNLYN